jgi:hypothetical protein
MKRDWTLIFCVFLLGMVFGACVCAVIATRAIDAARQSQKFEEN